MDLPWDIVQVITRSVLEARFSIAQAAPPFFGLTQPQESLQYVLAFPPEVRPSPEAAAHSDSLSPPTFCAKLTRGSPEGIRRGRLE